ncbi:MAG: DUF11 domain-containing protein, partial [Chloroflexi bacterium]|nr:DUF11 domain-containing protein [Chloroflexota bacterium]
VRGHLDAIGTATHPITFTSAEDSKPGEWSGVVFDGGTGDLQNAMVRYGGAENSLGVRSNIAITNVLSGEVSIGYSTIISGGHDWGTPREDYGIYLHDSYAIVANTDIYANGNDPNNDAALYIDSVNSVITVTGSMVRNNSGVGVELNQGDLRFLCAEVSNNGSDGICVNGGSLSVLGSGLFGNEGFDLDNNTSGQIDATNNWWGDSNGPSTGQIDGDVAFEPFLPVYVCVTELEVTQTDAPYDPILAGELLTYTIAVTNIGRAPLPQLVMSDTLDAGVHYVTSAVSQGTGCTEVTTGTVNCDLGAMAIGQTETATIQVKTDVEGVITNTIMAFSEGTEGLYPLGTPITETTTLEPAADIWPSIQGMPDPAAVGFPLTYTVAAHNDGPSTAQDVTLTYTWPITVEFASLSPAGACMRNGNDSAITCDWGEMAQDAVVSATVVVTPRSQGWLQSWAEVASSTADWHPGNETTTYELKVAPSSDLSVTMGLAPDPPNYVSSPLTYTIEVINDGPDALAAVVSDTLPVSATFLSASTGCAAPVGGVVTCTLNAMDVGAQKTLTVAVMAPSEVMTLTNHVEVVAQGSDPRYRNNVVEIPTPLTPKADLRVTTLDAPAAVALDAPITYTIEISNAGPSMATHVRLTDTLPSNVVFNAATPAGCSYVEGGHLVMCDWGALAPGAGLTVTVMSTATHGGAAENIVAVAAVEHDHVAGSNIRSVTTQVASVVDLHVTLSDDPDPVTAGEQLTYTLVVANAGPDAATGVMLTNTLPVDVVYSSTETVQGTPFFAMPGVITYSLGAIPAGEAVTATVFVTVSPSARGTLEASATAIAAEDDLNAGNNRDIVEPTTVNAETDLSVGLIQAAATVTAGQEFTYTVAVTNSGPSTAMAVVLTDTLPSALAYVGAEVSLVGGSCQAADVGVTCTLGTLSLHQTAWVTMTLAADPGASGQVVSTITAASLEVDPDMEHNTLDIPTTILASAEGGAIYLPLVMRSSSP